MKTWFSLAVQLVSLYADLKAAESRPTDDVDIIIELASYHNYVVLDERLRDAGFVNDTASGVSLTKKGGVTLLPTIYCPARQRLLNFYRM